MTSMYNFINNDDYPFFHWRDVIQYHRKHYVILNIYRTTGMSTNLNKLTCPSA